MKVDFCSANNDSRAAAKFMGAYLAAVAVAAVVFAVLVRAR